MALTWNLFVCVCLRFAVQEEVLTAALIAEREEREQERKAMRGYIKKIEAEREALASQVTRLQLSNQAAKRLATRLAESMPRSFLPLRARMLIRQKIPARQHPPEH